MKTVGILALQGDFAAHEAMITQLGAKTLEIREAAQFKEIDGLIIPGGESSTMLKLLHYDRLMGALTHFAREKPILGTCAGAILLAKTVSNPTQESLGAIDMAVERNGYGRQNESRIVTLTTEPSFQERTKTQKIEAVFIRAPIICHAGSDVKILAHYQETPVLVEQGLHMAATFHPELTADTAVHALFLSKL